LYTKAYCDFFFFELASAATELERAISISPRQDPAGLSLAYTGYGSCKSGLCEFDAACDAYNNALHFSTSIGMT